MALVVIFAVIMTVLNLLFPAGKIDIPYRMMVSIMIFSIGLVVIVIGGYRFRKAGTVINPMTPEQSTTLVTTGIYQLSRNPQYVGFLLWLLACVVFIGNVVNVLLLPLYVLLVNGLYIEPEEKALEKIFKSEYVEYKKRARRWI